MRLTFLGPPGAGKGTQAKKVASHYGIPHVSTGDLLRSEVARNSELGIEAFRFMSAGELVPDGLVVEMVKRRVSADDCESGYLLDGFPRTVDQAEALDDAVAERPLTRAIYFEVDDAEVVRRLNTRRTCRSCGATYQAKTMPEKSPGICDQCEGEVGQRSDDREDLVRNRLEVYRKETAPVVAHYERKGLLTTIEAGRSIEEVRRAVMDALSEA